MRKQGLNIVFIDNHFLLSKGVSKIFQSFPAIQMFISLSTHYPAILLKSIISQSIVLLDPEKLKDQDLMHSYDFMFKTGLLIILIDNENNIPLQLSRQKNVAIIPKKEVSEVIEMAQEKISVFLENYQEPEESKSDFQFGFSRKELMVITQLSKGMSKNEISGLLGITPKAVHSIIGKIMNKLQLSNISALIRFSFRYGLNNPE